jgi:hypothetical protein
MVGVGGDGGFAVCVCDLEVGKYGETNVEGGGFERAGDRAERRGDADEVCPGGRSGGRRGKNDREVAGKKTEEIYARTATPVTVQWNAQTNIVMGEMADVHAGAVVHVTGTVQKDHSSDAEQIVILTGYVKVR